MSESIVISIVLSVEDVEYILGRRCQKIYDPIDFMSYLEDELRDAIEHDIPNYVQDIADVYVCEVQPYWCEPLPEDEYGTGE